MQAEVVIVGAGIFGLWSALRLQEAGLRTLLVDAWEVGHLRATSSGESRIIRCSYGPQTLYTDWAREALREWRSWNARWGGSVLHETGVLWLASPTDPFLQASLAALAEREIPHELLTPTSLSRRFPPFRVSPDEQVYLELEAGVLLARKACRRLFHTYGSLGGTWCCARVRPPRGEAEHWHEIELEDGSILRAARVVLACGPWLPAFLPGNLRKVLDVTRQEVFFFGLPGGWNPQAAWPAWIDLSHQRFYGIPPLAGRGLKVACDQPGAPFDPESGSRLPSREGEAAAREYLASRLPRFSSQPLLETRVCQYERTPDQHLLLDWHPRWKNVLLVGGGSGHGFKLGPAVGRRVAACLQEKEPPPAQLSLRGGDRISKGS